VALAALFAAGAFSGAFTAFANFTDPGVVVRWGAPVATVVTELAVAVTMGALALAACVLPRGPLVDRALGVAGVSAGLWTLAALVQLVLRFSWSFYVPLDSPTFGTALMEYVSNIEIGRTYLGIVILAALTAAVALLVRGRAGALCTLALPLVALGMQSSTGHAAGAASHDVAISALFLHLGGAALWVGGLGAIALIGLRYAATADVIRRYSEIAFWCFLAVAVSGLVSAWIRIGSLDGLATDYGILLVVKAALLIVLGSLGYLHRSTVVARLSAGTTRNAAIGLFWRLAAVEIGVMGAVSGVAVALGSTAPPVPDDAIVDPTPAEIVTGHPLPPEPTLLRWFTEFQWDVILAFACAAAIFVYVRWTLRLRRRGDAWPVGRTISWCLGILILFWATNGGAAAYGHVLFSAHMVQHMVLAMVVPLFLVLAAPVTLLLRAVPARKDDSRGPREWVLVLVHSAFGRFMANPVVAAVLFAGGMIVFYFTPLFELALTTYAGHLWMVAHFTLAAKLASFGWHVERADGHDPAALGDVLERLRAVPLPKVVIADTIKGRGVSFMEHTALESADALYRFHSGAPSAADYARAVAELIARIETRAARLALPPPQIVRAAPSQAAPVSPSRPAQRLIAAYGRALVERAAPSRSRTAASRTRGIITAWVPRSPCSWSISCPTALR
jgi:putative copper resistance protein D